MDLVGHMECGMEVCKGIPESLRALEVSDVRWQQVPVDDGRRIKVSFVASSWRKRLDPLVRWSFSCTKSGLMSMMPCWILNNIVNLLM